MPLRSVFVFFSSLVLFHFPFCAIKRCNEDADRAVERSLAESQGIRPRQSHAIFKKKDLFRATYTHAHTQLQIIFGINFTGTTNDK